MEVQLRADGFRHPPLPPPRERGARDPATGAGGRDEVVLRRREARSTRAGSDSLRPHRRTVRMQSDAESRAQQIVTVGDLLVGAQPVAQLHRASSVACEDSAPLAEPPIMPLSPNLCTAAEHGGPWWRSARAASRLTEFADSRSKSAADRPQNCEVRAQLRTSVKPWRATCACSWAPRRRSARRAGATP